MTTEKRILISPDEIIGVELECRYCGAKHLVRFQKLVRMLYQCSNCKEPLIKVEIPERKSAKSTDEELLIAFVDLLKELQTRTLNAIVRFEVANPPEV